MNGLLDKLLWTIEKFIYFFFLIECVGKDFCVIVKVSLLGVDSLWGVCTFIPVDCGS